MISPHCGHVGSGPRFRIWNWHATQPNIPCTRCPTWNVGRPVRFSDSSAPSRGLRLREGRCWPGPPPGPPVWRR